MLKRIHLQGVGPAPELDVELAPRLNLLTGDNGVGKTFLLDIAWWALAEDWGWRPAWPSPESVKEPEIEYDLESVKGGTLTLTGVFDFVDQQWLQARRPDRISGLVLYARVDGSFSLWDSARNGSGYRRGAEDPYHFTPEQVWNGLKGEGDRVLCEGLIRDWVSWQRQGSDAYSQLEAVLKTLSPGDQEQIRPGAPVRVSIDDVRDHPTLQMPYGTVPLILASAGMKRVISLAYLLVWAWQEHQRASALLRQPEADRVVFLIDEVECHLHPRWQRLFLPALLSVMDRLRSDVQVQVIATTHAPLVLASVEPEFDEARDALIHLLLEGTSVRIENQPWAKQGDAVNWLVSESFGLRQARSRDAERAIEAAEAWMRDDQAALPADLATPDAIHSELVRLLPGHDPFWPRWIVSTEAATRRG
jgi:AAA domain, putative AbiEii toxin, Type IV TA system